ncbi:MAG: hypothetical protein AAB898_01260 [Patescibacteria group bacterium]
MILTGAVTLFFAYAWFPLATAGFYNAPDELAAAYFAQRISLFGGDNDQPAAYADELGGLVHPRSTIVAGGELVPGMWLGLPWVLGFVKMMTRLPIHVVVLVVPLLSVLAVLAWQKIVAKLFHDPRIGWFAALALAMHPGWWYFTSRGLHPNALFVSLLIFGAFFWYVASAYRPPQRAHLWRQLMIVLGGLSFGFAIFTRTNELIWIAPLLLSVAWRCRRKPVADHVLAIVGVAVPIVFMLLLNASLYGHPLRTGYTVASDPIPVETSLCPEVFSADGCPAPTGFENKFLAALFPFGLHEMNIFRNVLDFHVAFFVLWSAFAVFGLIALVVRWPSLPMDMRRGLRRALVVSALISAYLFSVYGSWNIHDNPDPNAVTIGTSYIRYWLPISVAMTASAGALLVWGVGEKKSKRSRAIILGVWVAAFVVGGTTAMFGEDEGLVYARQAIVESRTQREWVLERTQANDLIIVDRSDKFLFPDRNVVYPLRSKTTYAALPLMVNATGKQNAAVYYFGVTLPDTDLEHLRQTRLAPNGLAVEVVGTIDILTLYRISQP